MTGAARGASGTTTNAEESSSHAPGEVLDGRFRLVQRIGRGGFGEVWRAEELLPDGTAIREVALKLLAADADLATWGDEARLLASFSHPSLVTILAAGVLSLPADDRPAGEGGIGKSLVPFVAMELLEGETLGALLSKRGRLPWRRVLGWARDIAAALDVIHERGVVHLDLKPTNLLLTKDGRVKVLDFGIARRAGSSAARPAGVPASSPGDEAMATADFLAERSAPPSAAGPLSTAPRRVVGTPGFMAPEVIEQRAATPAADAYALAACIVQLATGSLPQDAPPAPTGIRHAGTDTSDEEQRRAREAWWAEVRRATLSGRVCDLTAAPFDLPRGVARMCSRLLSLEPDAREVAAGGLAAVVDAACKRPFGVPDPPYLGLRVFGAEQEGMLFGRDDDVARLARELESRPVLVLQGASGSGKSSLALAGVVPARAWKDAARGRDPRSASLTPGRDPDAALESALGSIDAELATADLAALQAWCDRCEAAVVLVVDQLEEVVTQADPERRERLVALLADAAVAAPESRVRVVATLREDFTSTLLSIEFSARPSASPRDSPRSPLIEPLGERLRDALRFVGPPTAAAVREIVGQPAELAGARVEGLSDVAADVERELRAGDGRLPLVAIALAAWWEARERRSRGAPVLTRQAWAELGGVRRIFAAHADGIFTALDEAAQAEARATMVRLSTEAKTRRAMPRSELREAARNPSAFDAALAAFLDAGLLVDRAGGIEVAHDVLFTAWERLEGWLADARANRRLAAALREGARAWVDLGRSPTRLPGPAEIALAELALRDQGFDGDDRDLLQQWMEAGRSAGRRRKMQGALAAAVAAVFVAAALALWARTVSFEQARAEQAKHEAKEAADQALEQRRRAESAQREADNAREEAEKSRKERERAGEIARRQEEEFTRLLREAEGEVSKAKVRCAVVQNAPKIRSGVCPPGDPLCYGASNASNSNIGNFGSLGGSLPSQGNNIYEERVQSKNR